MREKNNEPLIIGILFIVIPAIFLIAGNYIFTSDQYHNPPLWLNVSMFFGLILLFIGFFFKDRIGNILRILGWIVFSFYWATQPMKMYLTEGGDIVNAVICATGVFVLCYVAYHEWLSMVRKKDISCLKWLAGASAFAGIIYFGIERSFAAEWLIHRVAEQSTWILNTIAGNATVQGSSISLDGHYVVTIIFACTGIQSFVIFIGMIGALPKIEMKRRIIGLFVTVVPVYILNLLRNAMVAFLVGRDITGFNMAHNVIAKAGSLVALIVLLLIVIKIVPEVFDEIICFTDLYKRNGPLEKVAAKVLGRKK